MSRRILLLSDDFGRQHCLSVASLRRLAALGDVTHLHDDSPPERVRDELAGSWAVVVAGWETRVPYLGEPELRGLPALAFVGCGQDGRWRFLDVPAALKRGIACVDASGAMGADVAEFALGLLLGCLRDLPQAHRAVAEGGWGADRVAADRFTSLRGRRVGIVGMGGTGRSMAALLSPFGCRVSAWSSYLTAERAAELGVRLSPIRDLCGTSDVLVVTTQPRRDTAGIVDAACVAALPRDSVVVLVGRASTVDTSALYDRVLRGEIRLGIDVYEEEPLPARHPLRGAPGVLHTPHIAGLTGTANRRIFDAVVDDLTKVGDGRPPAWGTTAARYTRVKAGRRTAAGGNDGRYGRGNA